MNAGFNERVNELTEKIPTPQQESTPATIPGHEDPIYLPVSLDALGTWWSM
jgi:hypothetical protein